MYFEWDPKKDMINRKKHHIDFMTASHVFNDEHRIEIYDARHSEVEDRFITIGLINEILTVVTVVYTTRKRSIRIISARKADESERSEYYDGKEKY
ncbi:MAG: BrnT family toxin [Lachnospiraceae bacterium]|nr:BrnT family toxin [Lachnospiraceae bacterium]